MYATDSTRASNSRRDGGLLLGGGDEGLVGVLLVVGGGSSRLGGRGGGRSRRRVVVPGLLESGLEESGVCRATNKDMGREMSVLSGQSGSPARDASGREGELGRTLGVGESDGERLLGRLSVRHVGGHVPHPRSVGSNVGGEVHVGRDCRMHVAGGAIKGGQSQPLAL